MRSPHSLKSACNAFLESIGPKLPSMGSQVIPTCNPQAFKQRPHPSSAQRTRRRGLWVNVILPQPSLGVPCLPIPYENRDSPLNTVATNFVPSLIPPSSPLTIPSAQPSPLFSIASFSQILNVSSFKPINATDQVKSSFRDLHAKRLRSEGW